MDNSVSDDRKESLIYSRSLSTTSTVSSASTISADSYWNIHPDLRCICRSSGNCPRTRQLCVCVQSRFTCVIHVYVCVLNTHKNKCGVWRFVDVLQGTEGGRSRTKQLLVKVNELDVARTPSHA